MVTYQPLVERMSLDELLSFASLLIESRYKTEEKLVYVFDWRKD